MRAFGTFLGLILAIALVAALGAAAWYGYRIVVAVFSDLDPQLAAVTAIFSLSVLAGAVVVASAIRAASRHHRSSQLFEQKAATYQLLIDCVTDRGLETAEAATEKRLALDRLLALYGSAGVIKAYANMQSAAANDRAEGRWDAVVAQVRKDLGAEMQGLAIDDLRSLIAGRVARRAVATEWPR